MYENIIINIYYNIYDFFPGEKNKEKAENAESWWFDA